MKRPLFLICIFVLALLLASPVSARTGAGDGSNPPAGNIRDLYEQSTEISRFIITGISIAFGVGFLINLVRAQLARGTGDRLGYARALQQGMGMVILLALAGNVELISAGLFAIGSGINPDPSDAVLVYGVWESLARFFITAILGGAGIYTTVSALGAGMAGQLSLLSGSPTGVSHVLSSGLVLIGGGLLTLMAVLFANSMIAAVF